MLEPKYLHRNNDVRRRPAYTMIDVVLTMLIIGILAAAAAPKYAGSVERFKVKAAAKRLAADLRRARHEAKTTGASQSVVFTPAANTYDLPGMSDINRPGQSAMVDLTSTDYPASLVSASFGAGSATTVTFSMYGRPDEGGTVVLQVGITQRTVVVDAVSGKVSIQP